MTANGFVNFDRLCKREAKKNEINTIGGLYSAPVLIEDGKF